MSGNEYGFATPIAMAAISSLCIMVLSSAMLVAASERKIFAYQNTVFSEKEAEERIEAIGIAMQVLKDEPYDDLSRVNFLSDSFSGNDFCMEDVSTGVNVQFLKKEIIESSLMQKYLAGENAMRSAYGWMHPKCSDNEMLEAVAEDFGVRNPFPIVNAFPLYNLHEMDAEFLAAVLAYCKIVNPENAAETIRRKPAEEITMAELCDILNVTERHTVFDFIGLKTAFWKISFETARCDVEAIFAAIPEKDDPRKIAKYALVEKSISHKGGML